jgi:hypothetical protein
MLEDLNIQALPTQDASDLNWTHGPSRVLAQRPIRHSCTLPDAFF